MDPYWACHHPQTWSKLNQLGLSADLGGGGLGVRLAPSLAQVLGGLWGSWLLRDPQNGAQHRTRAVHTDTQPVVARRYRVNNPLVFRRRVLGTTPQWAANDDLITVSKKKWVLEPGCGTCRGFNGSLSGKQSVVVLSDYCIRRRPKKEAVSAEEGSCISLVRSKVMRAVQAFCFHIGGPPYS